MTELVDLVGSLQREVALPGEFASEFPLANDDVLAAQLGDSFAALQLEGFFHSHSLDLDDWVISPDLTLAGRALVVLNAAIGMLQLKILYTSGKTRYVAGPVSAEESANTYAQTEMMKQLERRRDALLAGRDSGVKVFVMDAYLDTSGFGRGELP